VILLAAAALAASPPESAPAAPAPSAPAAAGAPAASASAVAPAPPTAPLPPHARFPAAAAALPTILASNPRILGVGELHARTDGPAGPTTLARFTNELFPVLAPHTTDLVIETWRLDGRCGPQEEQVAEQVQEDTKRPEATKSELVLLVEAAVAASVRPHDLAITCDEYARIQTDGGGVDYTTLLQILTVKLGEFAKAGFEAADATVVLYGGAVHNDVAPTPALAPFAYGAEAAARGSYVELDLYDPALLRAVPALVDAPLAALLGATGPDHVVLYARAPNSFVLLLPEARR
jgi:hypothetical protein